MKVRDVVAAQALMIRSSITLPLAIATKQYRADTLSYCSNSKRLLSACCRSCQHYLGLGHMNVWVAFFQFFLLQGEVHVAYASSCVNLFGGSSVEYSGGMSLAAATARVCHVACQLQPCIPGSPTQGMLQSQVTILTCSSTFLALTLSCWPCLSALVSQVLAGCMTFRKSC